MSNTKRTDKTVRSDAKSANHMPSPGVTSKALAVSDFSQTFGGKEKISTELGNIPKVFVEGEPADGAVTEPTVTLAPNGSAGNHER